VQQATLKYFYRDGESKGSKAVLGRTRQLLFDLLLREDLEHIGDIRETAAIFTAGLGAADAQREGRLLQTVSEKVSQFFASRLIEQVTAEARDPSETAAFFASAVFATDANPFDELPFGGPGSEVPAGHAASYDNADLLTSAEFAIGSGEPLERLAKRVGAVVEANTTIYTEAFQKNSLPVLDSCGEPATVTQDVQPQVFSDVVPTEGASAGCATRLRCVMQSIAEELPGVRSSIQELAELSKKMGKEAVMDDADRFRACLERQPVPAAAASCEPEPTKPEVAAVDAAFPTLAERHPQLEALKTRHHSLR
jgi:hypothetical protein